MRERTTKFVISRQFKINITLKLCFIVDEKREDYHNTVLYKQENLEIYLATHHMNYLIILQTIRKVKTKHEKAM